MEHGGIVLMDLLWSDPTTNDGTLFSRYLAQIIPTL